MKVNFEPIILMADDDADDKLMMKEALAENNINHSIYFVSDGAELMDYLHERGKFLLEKLAKPSLIILDLNMPKIDGREALGLIKSDTELKRIPIIVLTTSKAEDDIMKAYDLGVNSFISKPVGFSDLVTLTREICNYWFGTVALPKQ